MPNPWNILLEDGVRNLNRKHYLCVMKRLQSVRTQILAITFALFVSAMPLVSTAQCAMCSLNAENSTKEGNTQGNGLNGGILFLLSMPFIIGAGMGLLWYTKFRRPEQHRVPASAKGTLD